MRCICAQCAPVDNRTFVHVLQHPRERFHPFGTARIVELTLSRVAVHVAFGRTQQDVHHPIALPDDAVLLYPRPDAVDLHALPPQDRPRNLVVLDGTWRQARQLYRDNPWLARLPCVRIDPAEPSRYRIRKEPAPHCLSTVESTALALQALEPETEGLQRLSRAFEAMIDQQIAHDWDDSAPIRRKIKRPRESRAVPEALRGDPARLLVVYGESSQISTRQDPRVPELLQWTALRPATGACFERFVAPARGRPDEAFLARMGLGEGDLEGGLSPAELREVWSEFARPDDVALSWNASSLALLASVGIDAHEPILLKAAYANAARRKPGMLEAVIKHEGLQPRPAPVHGRAADRLANATAVAEWLRARPKMTVGG